jgi:predicted ATPase
MKGIRILESEIEGVKIPLSNYNDKHSNDNYYTVIIGSNASGKSRLLVNILNTLREVSNPRLKSKSNLSKLVIDYNNEKLNIKLNSTHEYHDVINDINLVSISNSLFDKFPHEVKSDTNYSYIGSRMLGLSTHKRAIVNDLMDVFSDNLEDEVFIKKALQLFEFLKIPPVICISLRISSLSNRHKYEELIYRSQTPSSLRDFLIEMSQRGFYRQQSKKIFDLVQDDLFIEGLFNFLNTDFLKIKNENVHKYRVLDYVIDLSDENKNESFIKEYKFFSLLRRLNFLTYDRIELNKNGLSYDIIESSTGEIGLLTTFLRAIPQVKSNSVIFIDEPEISLHPSWQMRYIDLLKKFLAGYKGCHVLIATHSHFLLSDLHEDWSSVLVLRNQDGKINASLKESTPYGWTPEAILYDVFGVSTVRNHYFEQDLRKLLSLISNRSKNIKMIQSLISNFKEFDYLPGDPLEKIIQEAEEYIKK